MRRWEIFTYETGIGTIAGLTLACIIVLFIRIFSPVLCSLGEEELQSIFNKVSNEAIISYLEQNDASEIVKIERTQDGNIQGITTDTVAVNKLKAEITLYIQNEIDKISEIQVKVPTGGFLGLGGGIDIPIALMSMTVVEPEITSSFESVGINQTKICVNTVISLSGKLLSIGRGNPVKIKTQIPLMMTVIVGEVPGTYVNVQK